MISIDLKSAIEFAEEAVASKPARYVYVNPAGQMASEDLIDCDYWDDNQDIPSCIVGQILHLAGVDKASITDHRSLFASSYLDKKSDILNVSFGASVFMEEFQRRQDRGQPWAEILADLKVKITNN